MTPAEGQAIKSGAVVSGTVSVTPFENNLVYRVYAGSNGQILGSGSLTVKDVQAQPGTFAGPIQFTPSKEQVGRLEVLDIDTATGKTFARAAVNVDFGAAMKPLSGKPRTIVITAPVAGAVSNHAPLQGTTSITPFENNLIYRVYQGGQLIRLGRSWSRARWALLAALMPSWSSRRRDPARRHPSPRPGHGDRLRHCRHLGGCDRQIVSRRV